MSTGDAILITHHDKDQDVSLAVKALTQEDREEIKYHQEVYCPWGHYQIIRRGNHFQIKRLTVNPGASLSLQKHNYRFEHWFVMEGVAQVTINDNTFILNRNDSIDVPIGAIHRIENFSNFPLNVIEVQTGEYLREDDIVRLEDNYGRATLADKSLLQ